MTRRTLVFSAIIIIGLVAAFGMRTRSYPNLPQPSISDSDATGYPYPIVTDTSAADVSSTADSASEECSTKPWSSLAGSLVETPHTNIVPDAPGKIRASEASRYGALSVREQGMLLAFQMKVMEEYHSKCYANNVAPNISYIDQVDGCYLVYYDESKALVGCAVPKVGISLGLYDTTTWKQLQPDWLYWGPGSVSTDAYFINASDYGVTYYRAGDNSIRTLPDSTPKSGETYDRTGGLGGTYDVRFSEATKELLVSVYKNIPSEGNTERPFVRTASFTLP